MRAKLEQAALGPLYTMAITLRNLWWRVSRPLLMGVRVLVVRGDDVLLIRHRGGRFPWSLPGGGVDRREPLAEAARRECFEEAGLVVHVERLHGVYDNFYLGMSNYIAVFVATPEGEIHPHDTLEIAEARFFPMRALPPNTEPGSIRRVAEFHAGASGLHGKW